MKKMLLRYCAGPAYYRMCSTDVYCSKQTGSSSTKEIITHRRVSELGRRKLSTVPKFVAAQKMLLKQKPSKNIRKWIARFYYFRHLYSAGSACIAHNNCMSVYRYGHPIQTLINILLGSFQLFLKRISLSEGEIIPFSVSASREARHPRRRRWWLHALTDRLL